MIRFIFALVFAFVFVIVVNLIMNRCAFQRKDRSCCSTTVRVMMRVTRGDAVTGLEGDADHGAQAGDSKRKKRPAPRAPNQPSTRALLPALAAVMTRNAFQRRGDELAGALDPNGKK